MVILADKIEGVHHHFVKVPPSLRPISTRLGRWRLGVMTVAVFLFAFFYRFNAMGGALGGFDGDHFMYYLSAQRVLHGEQPLRDFADLGLQGAWPALTYELPALAYRIGGETFLTEAVFTIGMVALSLSMLFVSATALAGPASALTVTFATLFLGVKLYGYTKVLAFSGAVLLSVYYAWRPSSRRVALLAVWSAVAFLLRHDFLVYLGPPIAVLVLGARGIPWRERFGRLLVYGLVLAALLIGPIYSIQRYVGVQQYLKSNLELTARESSRTAIDWPRFTAVDGGVREFFADEKNATAWLYYLCLVIPVLALLALGLTFSATGPAGGQSRALILSLVLLTALLDWFLLRGNTATRFGDLGAPVAVVTAWLTTTWRGASVWVKRLCWSVTTALLVATVLAIDTTGSVWHELDTTGFRDSAGKVVNRLRTATAELSGLPGPSVGDLTMGIPDVAEYIRACTKPGDRVLVFADAPEILALGVRTFAAGMPTFRSGFYTLPEDQELILRRLRSQIVPVALTDVDEVYRENYGSEFPLVDQAVMALYEPVGQLRAPAGEQMRILARRGLTPSSRYGTTELPCFPSLPIR